MNKFVRLGMLVDDGSGETLLIRPPRKKILYIATVLFAVGVLLLGLTVNSLVAVVTLPLMVIWGYLYYMFCRIWVTYRYSKFYLVIIPIVMLVLSFLLRFLISTLF